MFSTCSVDDADIFSHCRANIAALSGFAERAERRLHHVIKRERSTHRYKNRTGHAEQSTVIHGRAVGTAIDVDIEAGANYASYLDGKHSRFSQLVSDAFLDIDADVRRMVALAES